MQAIGYIRVSTLGQADEGINLEAQRQRIEARCLVNEYSLTDVFVDAGVSGKGMTGRQGLQADLAKADSPIVAHNYPRFRIT